jgi:hypothetical protein
MCTDSTIIREKLEQLETSEVEVVPFPADDEYGVDASCHRGAGIRN